MNSSEGNSGWADAMGKILVAKKPKKNKTIILSKGKKLSLMKNENENEEPKSVQLNSEAAIKKCDIHMKGRKKPNILEKDREKHLQKVTVKGVVKLFNAVNKHQQTNKDKLESSGPVITKKEKTMNSVSKSSFLNYLIGENKEEEIKQQEPKKEVKMEDESDEEEEHIEEPSSTWEVLQSNYGIGVKMKDWDNKAVNV